MTAEYLQKAWAMASLTLWVVWTLLLRPENHKKCLCLSILAFTCSVIAVFYGFQKA